MGSVRLAQAERSPFTRPEELVRGSPLPSLSGILVEEWKTAVGTLGVFLSVWAISQMGGRKKTPWMSENGVSSRKSFANLLKYQPGESVLCLRVEIFLSLGVWVISSSPLLPKVKPRKEERVLTPLDWAFNEREVLYRKQWKGLPRERLGTQHLHTSVQRGADVLVRGPPPNWWGHTGTGSCFQGSKSKFLCLKVELKATFPLYMRALVPLV